MREILFRGKDKNDGTWFEGFFVKQGDDAYLFTKGQVNRGIGNNGWLNCCQMYSVIPETIGQYTGLKDKNGRHIFEGDILKEDYRFGGKHILHAVEFGESSFGTKRFVSGKLSDFCVPFDDCENPLYAEGETEVIGNIHDNPELLKEGEE